MPRPKKSIRTGKGRISQKASAGSVIHPISGKDTQIYFRESENRLVGDERTGTTGRRIGSANRRKGERRKIQIGALGSFNDISMTRAQYASLQGKKSRIQRHSSEGTLFVNDRRKHNKKRRKTIGRRFTDK